jgi:demethoxyubiquinone hydroxylase (CLK1/Coq7/Cat5 family)
MGYHHRNFALGVAAAFVVAADLVVFAAGLVAAVEAVGNYHFEAGLRFLVALNP